MGLVLEAASNQIEKSRTVGKFFDSWSSVQPWTLFLLKLRSLWDTVKGPLLTLRGKSPLLLTLVLLRALQFLPTIPLPGRGIPPMER